MLRFGWWFRVMLSDKFSIFSSSLHTLTTRLIWAPHARNIVSVHDFTWSLSVKGDCSSFRIKKSFKVQQISLFSQWSVSSVVYLFSQHAMDWTMDSRFVFFSEWVIHGLTNTGFNVLCYYVEEDELSGIIHGLRVDFIIQDNVQKPQCIFFSKVPGSGSINFVSSLHSIPHTYSTWQTHVFAD